MNIQSLLGTRAKLFRSLRDFFADKGVLEVATPILARSGTTDPAIESFRTESTPDQAGTWLRTSPEFFHKRLLAAGSGPIYELGPVFRSGELGARHNPEFTMLEWYRPGFDEAKLIAEVLELVAQVARALGANLPPVMRMSYRELYQRYAELDPFTCKLAALNARCAQLGCMGELEFDEALDLIRSLEIEPQLRGLFLVLTDFPPAQAALAQIKDGSPPTAARFELYLDGLELANGYHELTDPIEQARRFQADLQLRSMRGKVHVPPDQHFLAALKEGLPDCSGVAMGVDRLLLALTGKTRLAEVLPFPFEQV